MKKNVIIFSLLLLFFGLIGTGKAEAAFPTVQSVTETSISGASTNHYINMPATVNSGDLLIISFALGAVQASQQTLTTPSGWTLLASAYPALNTLRGPFGVYVKVADGTEGGTTVNIISTNSYAGSAQTYRVTSWYGSLTGVAVSTVTTGSSSIADPGSLTPSWGAMDTLWIETVGLADDDGLFTSYSANYTNGVDTVSTAGLNLGSTVGSSYRNLNATVDDPGSMNISESEGWAAYTIGIRPGVPPAVPYVWYSSNVSPFSYTVGGYADPTGVQTYGYFRYGTTYPGTTCSDSWGTRYPASSASDWNLGSGSGYQYYNTTLTGLSQNTLYYWCAMTRNGSVGSSGSTSFSTDPATPATVSYAASSVFATTATFNGTSNPHTTSTTGWFRYWTSNPGSCSDSGGTRFPASSGNNIGTGNSAVFYKQQVTGLTASQAYWYCAISSNAYGTTYGTLKTFTTAANVGTSCTLMPGSTIKDGNDEAFLQTYLSNYEGTLVYKATTNGWTAANFHTAANNQGPTITVIKSTTNQVFGGYNSFPWDSTSGSLPGDEGFLFNLTNNYRLTNTNSAYQTYNGSSYGPTFGGGHDLGMPGALNATGTHYTNTNSYQNPNTQGAYTYLDGGGGSPSAYNFNASEVEVYRLAVCAPSTPVITSPTEANITYDSATLGGNITSQGGSAVTARGVCISTGDTTPTIAEGATCVADVSGGTGVFTVNFTGLNPAPARYYYSAYATNTQGTSYTAPTTTEYIDTLTNLPTGTDTSTATAVSSYYATLRGAANPNGFPTFGHFRVFTASPGTCSSDTGGFRFPESQENDIYLGSGTALVTEPQFQFTVPFNGSSFLTPGTHFWYCAYAVGSNGTAGGSLQTFDTPDGPASPCDPPTSGNLTIPATAVCAFPGTYSGVDAGAGTRNTGTMSLAAGVNLTVSSTQQIAFGALSAVKTATITFQRGATLRGGGLFVHDKDRDGVIDSQTQYIGSTPSASTEFVRRNTISTNYNYAWKIASSGASLDCDNNSQYVYRKLVPATPLVVDADNDGYKTAAGATSTACIGAESMVAGRHYYKDSSNVSSWMWDADKLSATADCLDTGTGGQGQAAASVYQNFTGYSDADNDNYTINSTATICSGSVILAYNSVTNPYRGSLSSPVDCQDNPNGTPCTPVSTSASNPSSQSQNSLSWAVNPNGGAVPAASSGYDIFYCSGANPCTTGASKISVGAGITSTTHSGLAAGTWYGYNFVAKNGAGSSTASSPNNYAQTLASCTTGFKDYDGDGYGAGSSACWNPSASYVVVASGGDCYDYDGANTTIENQSKLAKPGQTTYYTVVRGTASGVNDWAGQSYNSYDYNCDGNYTNTLTGGTTAPGSMPSRTYCSGGGPFTVNSYEAVSCAATCPPYYDCCSWNYACNGYTYCNSYTTGAISCGSTYNVYSSGPSYTSHINSASCGGGNNNVFGYYGTIGGSTTVSCR